MLINSYSTLRESHTWKDMHCVANTLKFVYLRAITAEDPGLCNMKYYKIVVCRAFETLKLHNPCHALHLVLTSRLSSC
jgi:hypothetical protein